MTHGMVSPSLTTRIMLNGDWNRRQEPAATEEPAEHYGQHAHKTSSVKTSNQQTQERCLWTAQLKRNSGRFRKRYKKKKKNLRSGPFNEEEGPTPTSQHYFLLPPLGSLWPLTPDSWCIDTKTGKMRKSSLGKKFKYTTADTMTRGLSCLLVWLLFSWHKVDLGGLRREGLVDLSNLYLVLG